MTNINAHITPQDHLAATTIMNTTLHEHLPAPHFVYVFECFDKDGNLKWREEIHNTVVNQGANDLLDKYFAGSAYTASFFLGLKGTGSAATGDTLASHGGWAEVTPYSGTRPAIAWSAASGRSKSASAAITYAINATATVAGAFIATVNSGTAGVLYSAGDFAASRGVAAGDTLNVTPTVSA